MSRDGWKTMAYFQGLYMLVLGWVMETTGHTYPLRGSEAREVSLRTAAVL